MHPTETVRWTFFLFFSLMRSIAEFFWTCLTKLVTSVYPFSPEVLNWVVDWFRSFHLCVCDKLSYFESLSWNVWQCGFEGLLYSSVVSSRRNSSPEEIHFCWESWKCSSCSYQYKHLPSETVVPSGMTCYIEFTGKQPKEISKNFSKL